MILKNQTMIYKNQTMIFSFVAYQNAFRTNTRRFSGEHRRKWHFGVSKTAQNGHQNETNYPLNENNIGKMT